MKSAQTPSMGLVPDVDENDRVVLVIKGFQVGGHHMPGKGFTNKRNDRDGSNDSRMETSSHVGLQDSGGLDVILKETVIAAVKEGLGAVGNGDQDEVLTVEGAMEFLKVETSGWVYRHADELGAVRLSSKCLRFTRSGLMAYLEGKKKGR